MTPKTIANRLGLLLLIALVVPFAIYAVPGLVGAEYSFIVLTGSMLPDIAPGDVVIVAEQNPETVEVGDVITYVRGTVETPVTHRVIGIQETAAGPSFETKGDANSDADPSLVPAANLIGVVILTIPYIGYVIQAVNSPVGFVLLVVVPLALLAATELRSLYRAGRRGAVADTDSTGESDETVATSGDEAAPAAVSGTALASAVGSGDDVFDSGVADTSTDGADNTPASGADNDTESGISITASDLMLSTAVLALLTPYTVYVALELTSALTISVAFATGLSLLAVGGLLITLRRPFRGDSPATARNDPVDDDNEQTDDGNNPTGDSDDSTAVKVTDDSESTPRAPPAATDGGRTAELVDGDSDAEQAKAVGSDPDDGQIGTTNRNNASAGRPADSVATEEEQR